jgi:hypothetical protein
MKYGLGSRLLHRLALANASVVEASFDVERLALRPEMPDRSGHAYVTGLARAGTTVLMRALHGSGAFASPTYLDMPFVLMPNLWKSMSGWKRRSDDPQERAHGDGIAVSPDSPEAFEEVFWRAFQGGDYILADRLIGQDINPETGKKYLEWVSLILRRYGRSRYLSKNNNNILRLGGLLDLLPGSTFFVVFRDPESHANSLLAQHLHFLALQKDESFTLEYMNWLGHHEFGAGYKPFVLDKSPLDAVVPRDAGNIEHWREMWSRYYAHALTVTEGNADVIFVSQDSLRNSSQVHSAIDARVGVACDWSEMRAPNPTGGKTAGPGTSAAESIYESLKARERETIGHRL